MKRKAVKVLLGSFVALVAFAAYAVIVIWSEVIESHFDRMPTDRLPDFIPADATAIDQTLEIDNGVQRYRFHFESTEWLATLAVVPPGRLGSIPTLAFTEPWTLPANINAYCGKWQSAWFSVAVDESTHTAWAWWSGPAVPSCGD